MRTSTRGCCAVVMLLIACSGPNDADGDPDAGGPHAAFDAGPDSPDDAGLDGGVDAARDGGADGGPDLADADADSGHADAGPSDSGFDATTPLDGVRVRVLAANLTSGRAQSYDPGHGIRIIDALDPDVVLVQEMNYGTNSEADIQTFVEMATQPDFSFYREPIAGIPNGIISRWPLLDAGHWDDPESNNRELSWARIDVPGPIDLWAVSCHLLTRSSATRQAEAAALVSYIEAQVPGGDYLVIGGDFNTDNAAEPALGTLATVVVFDATPVDQMGVAGTNANRTKPYDWVLADPDLSAYRAPVRLGSQVFPSGLVFDTRVYMPLSEVPPALVTDSSAEAMQHMAVVRDFYLPPE